MMQKRTAEFKSHDGEHQQHRKAVTKATIKATIKIA